VTFGILLALPASRSEGQPLLTVDEAVEVALVGNPEVRAVRTEVAIARANNTAGNAGRLPALSLTGSAEQGRTWTGQELASGEERHPDNGRESSLTGGVALDWTLYDGGGMSAARRRLAQLEAQGGARLRDQALQTVYAVVAAYYDVVRARQQLASVEEVVALNRERVRILATGVTAGQTQRANLLQARIDLNVYEGELVSQEAAVASRHRSLNLLLGRDPDLPFAVADSIPLPAALPDTTRLYERDPALESWRRQLAATQAAWREARALRLPRLSFGADYTWQHSGSTAGQVRRSTSSDVQAGLSLAVPLYAGGNLTRQDRVAGLQVESVQLALEAAERLARLQATEAIAQFEARRRMLELEEASAGLARENLEIARQRLRSGQGTSLEFREAQETWVAAATRRINLRYDLVLVELRLRQLVGELGPRTDLRVPAR
jgi:outer membrane protein TolC